MYDRRIIAISLLFTLGFVSYSSGQEAQKITCSGKVIDSNGQPVSGAKVSLYRMIIQMELLMFDTELVQETTTKDDGAFTFEAATQSNDMMNQTIILAEKEGLALGWGNWYLSRDLNIQITLGPPEILAGKVVDESGEPVQDAEVGMSLMFISEGDEPRYIAGKVSELLFSRKTDAAGMFQFERIPSKAAAELIVKKTGLATVSTYDEKKVQQMQLQFKAGQTDIEIKLPSEAKIEGIVVEKETGKPVPGVKLMVYQGQRQPLTGHEPVTSRENGTFTIGALYPGKHFVQAVPGKEGPAGWVTQPVEVTVEAGGTSTGVKVELSKGGVVKIAVTELDNTPIDGANVNILNTMGGEQFNEVTDANGIINKRLAPGQYQITQVYKQNYPFERKEETFTIEDGKTSRVAVQLQGYPKVSGILRDESGQPVAGAKVKVCPFGRGEMTTKSDGRFKVRRDSGEWTQGSIPYVVARHFVRNLAGAAEIGEGVMVMDVNMTTGVVCVGKIVDVNDKPIENAKVYLTFWSSNSGSSMARLDNRTDAEGRYEINAVPHHYKYSVNASAEGYGQDYVEITTEDSVDNRYEVNDIALAVANLSVAGIVVDNDDNPMENASIFCQGRGQPQKNVQADKDGKFIIESVCAGRIMLNASKSSGSKHLYGNIEVEGGQTDIRLVISDHSSPSAGNEPPSLVGKSLPDLSGLKIEPALTDIEDKAILICFWDMNQRPSRHCINQLIEQAEQLRHKGVIVVAIQAAKINKDTLDQWLKENNIPFAAGIIQESIEQTRFKWGVKSLPWLILTDKNHIITAEGFSINELDKKNLGE